jgi:hypothetical protein
MIDIQCLILQKEEYSYIYTNDPIEHNAWYLERQLKQELILKKREEKDKLASSQASLQKDKQDIASALSNASISNKSAELDKKADDLNIVLPNKKKELVSRT